MSEQNESLFDKIMGEYIQENADQAIEQFSRLLELRETENLKLSMILKSKDMDIELLNHALKIEKERSQNFIEMINRSEKSIDKAHSICKDLFGKLETAHEDYALMKKERDDLLVKLSDK